MWLCEISFDPSRSAIVRATFRILSYALAENDNSFIAAVIKFAESVSILQNCIISLFDIFAFRLFSELVSRSTCILTALFTLFLMISDGSVCTVDRISSIETGLTLI